MRIIYKLKIEIETTCCARVTPVLVGEFPWKPYLQCNDGWALYPSPSGVIVPCFTIARVMMMMMPYYDDAAAAAAGEDRAITLDDRRAARTAGHSVSEYAR